MLQSQAQISYQVARNHVAMVKDHYGEKSEQYDKALLAQINAEEALFEWGEEVLKNRLEWEKIEPIFWAVEPEQVEKVISILLRLDARKLAC